MTADRVTHTYRPSHWTILDFTSNQRGSGGGFCFDRIKRAYHLAYELAFRLATIKNPGARIRQNTKVVDKGWTMVKKRERHWFTKGRRNEKERNAKNGVSLRYSTIAHGSLLSRESTTCFTGGVDGHIHGSARHSRDLPVARRNVVKRNGYKHRPPPLGHGQYGVALSLAVGKLTSRENRHLRLVDCNIRDVRSSRDTLPRESNP